jgi:hypothetical protein
VKLAVVFCTLFSTKKDGIIPKLEEITTFHRICTLKYFTAWEVCVMRVKTCVFLVGILMAMAFLGIQGAIAAPENYIPISEQIGGNIVVLSEKPVFSADVYSTDQYLEGQDNRIYEEFELKDEGGNLIPLSDNVVSITVKKEGDQIPKAIYPEGDKIYWDVLSPEGIYTLTVETEINIYTAQFDWIPLKPVSLSWDIPENHTTIVQKTEEINIQAALANEIKSAGIQQINRVAYVFEITKGGVPVSSNDIYLIYDQTALSQTDGKFFFGGDQGFSCNDGMSHTFTIKFRTAGTFRIIVYAVQIN